MLVAVTDHAAERFRQRVRGTLDAKTEVAAAVARAYAAGRVEPDRRLPGTVQVHDLSRRDLVYVCRRDRDELVVITLWEEGEDAAVPRRFTDALRRDDERPRRHGRPT
jgi:heme-degrading monooxygenase HmoA